jgi:hypothetical protein
LKNLHIDNRYFTFNKKSKWALSKPNKWRNFIFFNYSSAMIIN